MTQVHFRKAGSGDYIKDWPNWTGVVPAFPDLVVLHYGDDNEDEKRYRVEGREISGTEPDDVTIYLSEYPSNQCNLTDEEREKINVQSLHLVLKKKWYEMQERGEKTEEYREITPYWIKRLVDTHRLGRKMLSNVPDVAASLIESSCVKMKPYTHVCFHYGYTQRCFINRIDSITIGRGYPEWGAPECRDVFIIKHHREPMIIHE